MILNRSKVRALQLCAPAAAVLGGLFLTPSLAAAAPCDDASIVNPVYVTGSSAVKPFLDAVAISLAKADTPITIVYPSSLPGSCVGVKAVGLGATNMTGTANWYDSTGTLQTCDLSAVNSGAGVPADIGASDVFADSCVNFDPDNHENIGDIYGPNQVMQFAVPAASNQTTISAEAAYLTYGLTDGGTNWDDMTLRFRRNENSGTQTMIAFAIFPDKTNPALKFNAHATAQSNAQAMVTALATPTGDVNKTIGILAAGETDEPANRTTIKRLAFQDYGQTCAYYPDSDFTSHDKINVRDGHYQIWGPLHLLTKVNTGTHTPSDADVKTVLDIITGKKKVDDVPVLDLAISKHMVPECAMHVQRTTELGQLTSFQPEGSCGCYFDAHVIGGSAPDECAPCDTDADCVNPDRKVCSFGYCEAK